MHTFMCTMYDYTCLSLSQIEGSTKAEGQRLAAQQHACSQSLLHQSWVVMASSTLQQPHLIYIRTETIGVAVAQHIRMVSRSGHVHLASKSFPGTGVPIHTTSCNTPDGHLNLTFTFALTSTFIRIQSLHVCCAHLQSCLAMFPYLNPKRFTPEVTPGVQSCLDACSCQQ